MLLPKSKKKRDVSAALDELDLDDLDSLFHGSAEELSKRLAEIDRTSVVTADVLHVQFTL